MQFAQGAAHRADVSLKKYLVWATTDCLQTNKNTVNMYSNEFWGRLAPARPLCCDAKESKDEMVQRFCPFKGGIFTMHFLSVYSFTFQL